uniref:Atg8e n=1 Tax=Arundo donax TaxID=35708 RepID=A0A0A9IN88_ARUDO
MSGNATSCLQQGKSEDYIHRFLDAYLQDAVSIGDRAT